MICSREININVILMTTILRIEVLINTYYKLELYMEGRECIYKVSLSMAQIMTESKSLTLLLSALPHQAFLTHCPLFGVDLCFLCGL